MSIKYILFIIVLIEGYVVLATELIAIRQMIPFVGSGTESIAIIIAAVLMPLAMGYYYGGRYKSHIIRGKRITIREKLIRNIINASLILTFGLSYVFLEIFFPIIEALGITHRIAQTAVYALLFLAYPTFLLGQTVPLVSNFFSSHKLSEVTGKMLFFSTIGSFAGSIISTLILMTFLGVHNTVMVNIGLLVALVLILSKRIFGINNAIMLFVLFLTFTLNNSILMKNLGIVENNNYNTIMKISLPKEKARVLSINRSASSKYAENYDNMFEYIKHIDQTFIFPINQKQPPKDILVLGAGGFTIGLDDHHNNYIFVDIDPSLKEISEEHLLKRKLPKNKNFIPEPARAFMRRNTKKYDLIILDAYSNVQTIPPQLITVEFLSNLKKHLKQNGIITMNFIISPNFNDKFSIKIDNTLRASFSNITRQIVQKYMPWNNQTPKVNVLYNYFHGAHTAEGVYTDNKNSYFLDKK